MWLSPLCAPTNTHHAMTPQRPLFPFCPRGRCPTQLTVPRRPGKEAPAPVALPLWFPWAPERRGHGGATKGAPRIAPRGGKCNSKRPRHPCNTTRPCGFFSWARGIRGHGGAAKERSALPQGDRHPAPEASLGYPGTPGHGETHAAGLRTLEYHVPGPPGGYATAGRSRHERAAAPSSSGLGGPDPRDADKGLRDVPGPRGTSYVGHLLLSNVVPGLVLYRAIHDIFKAMGCGSPNP
ncbi:hypothetical protein GWK47_010002 [Chionoecetes opilio]|uniref:Uncharacterized protein n=1 Tax=Chionoecetes opilio TaxID=41210 RepID=A0A8J4XXD5_CHIOP|nr:hypothetical protein GWK47_010002 [Chionoecetes opilio]